jgi:hypothetical protein
MYGDAKTPGNTVTYGNLTYRDETHREVTYGDVSSLYPYMDLPLFIYLLICVSALGGEAVIAGEGWRLYL